MAGPGRDRLVCGVLLLAAAVLAALTLWAPPSPLRLALVVAVMGSAPGWGLLGFRTPRDTALAWTAAIALSVSISILVSVGMLVTRHWRPLAGFWGVLGVTAVLLAWHVLRPRRRPEPV